MSKVNKCKLPENHRDYFYIITDTDRKTGKPKERKIYPNFFNHLVSIPRKGRKWWRNISIITSISKKSGGSGI